MLRIACVLREGQMGSWERACIAQLRGRQGVTLVAMMSAGGDYRLLRRGAPDVILSFDPSVTRAVRRATDCVVWSFRFGSDGYADIAGCFWDLHDARDTSAVTLVALRESENVLKAAVLPQAALFGRTLCALLAQAAKLPALVCDAYAGDAAAIYGDLPFNEATGRRVTARALLRALRISSRRKLIALVRLACREKWNIGIVNVPIARLASDARLPEVRWHPHDFADGYVADPMGFECAGSVGVLCEIFDGKTRRGRIESTTFASGWATTFVPAMTLHTHASYPYLFEFAGTYYCVPETFEAGEVALFRAATFPGPWEKAAVLVAGFAGVDSSVVRFGERWWLFCTDGRDLPDAKLHVFWAWDLLGSWQPHVHNPVKIDVRSSRSAGTPFVVDDVLYRPAQECSPTYGRRIAINRVDVLTPAAFAESTVSWVEPAALYPDGLHTICAVGDRCLVDGKRWEFKAPLAQRLFEPVFRIVPLA